MKRTIDQYDKLRSRKAYIDQYRREPVIGESLAEFDQCREVALDLVNEYRACEGEGYLVRHSPLFAVLTGTEVVGQDYGRPATAATGEADGRAP